MKDYDRYEDGQGRNGSWINLSNILAVVVLIFFLFLALGLRYIGDKEKETTESTESTTSSVAVTTTTIPTTTTTKPTMPSNTEEDAWKQDLLEREAVLNTKTEKIKEFAQIRSSIISELKEEFGTTTIEMEIDDLTGDVRLSEALLFGVSVDKVSTAGIAFLNDFIPAYLSVVLSEKNRQFIDQIIIEGHTDDEGTYLNNLALSQRRSVSVAIHIFQNELNILSDGTEADEYFAISGRSFSIPVETNGTIDRAKSRRVEFKFVLKDTAIINHMIDIVEGEN